MVWEASEWDFTKKEGMEKEKEAEGKE